MADTSSSHKTEVKKKPLKYAEGGTGCGVILRNLNVIMLSADQRVAVFGIRNKWIRGKKNPEKDVMIEERYEVPDKNDYVYKVCKLKDKFGVVGVGWRDHVFAWLNYLSAQATPGSTIDECRQILENYRLAHFADRGNIKTAELLLAGWTENGEAQLFYFHNGGCTSVDYYCIGTGAHTAWQTFDNTKFENMPTVKAAVTAVERTIYDAHLKGSGSETERKPDIINALEVHRNGQHPVLHQETTETLMGRFGTTTTFEEKDAARIERLH